MEAAILEAQNHHPGLALGGEGRMQEVFLVWLVRRSHLEADRTFPSLRHKQTLSFDVIQNRPRYFSFDDTGRFFDLKERSGVAVRLGGLTISGKAIHH